jgi:hypothetical protein
MFKRRRLARLIVLFIFAALAVLIPLSLPTLLNPGAQHDGHSVRYWRQALDSSDAPFRQKAIFSLGAIGSDAGAAAPALARIMRADPDPGIRTACALALSKMAPASHTVVPALAEALEDGELFVRMNAAIALFRLREQARPAIPALIKAIDDEENDTNLGAFSFTIQEIATLALGRTGASESVSPLLAVLSADVSEEKRRAAARALGEVGANAGPAVPQLRAMLQDGDPLVREVAEEALKNIEGDIPTGRGPSDKRTPGTDGGTPRDLELPDAERKYLWEIEHHGNVLVKHGFGPLAAALKNADAAALARLLHDDFTGAELLEPRRLRAAFGFAEVERLEDGGRPPSPLTRQGFIARLLEFRKLFSDPPQVKLALMTLSPRVRGRFAGLWEGAAQLRLHGEHSKGAPAEVVVQLRYEVSQPTEDVLARPGWLRAAAVQQVLTARAPHYLFAEVARERGLDTAKLHDNWTSNKFVTTSGGVYVCDFDRDGILDVLVTDINGNALYRGGADGKFEDVTERCGLPRFVDSIVAAWVDIDGDGWEDLILGGFIFRNEKGERFTNVTSRSNLRIPTDAGGIVVADYDRDGKLDLYVTRSARPGGKSWLDGKSGDPKGNYLFRNLGNWQFANVSKASGARGGRCSTFSAAWLDANNDGWPDLHVINEFGDGVLLVNQRDGTFSEHRLADRPADFGSMGVAVGDINNDGHIDIYCANMYSKAGTRVIGNLAPDAYPPPILEKMRRFVAGSQLHLNRGGLKFEQAGKRMQVASVGWAYGACLADLDNDGWLDLYATAGFYSRNRDEPDG